MKKKGFALRFLPHAYLSYHACHATGERKGSRFCLSCRNLSPCPWSVSSCRLDSVCRLDGGVPGRGTRMTHSLPYILLNGHEVSCSLHPAKRARGLLLVLVCQFSLSIYYEAKEKNVYVCRTGRTDEFSIIHNSIDYRINTYVR